MTLKSGEMVAGLYSSPGFASLWPYDRDLLLGQVWALSEGKPARLVAGSIGMYMSESEISTIEIIDYGFVVQSVTNGAEGNHAEIDISPSQA